MCRVRAAPDTGHCQLEVEVGWRGDRDRIHACCKQTLGIAEGCTAQRPGYHLPLLRIRVCHAHQPYPCHIGEDARVIAPHDPHADYADTQSGM